MGVWASEVGFGTDGSFYLDDSRLAHSFCRDTHPPGFPDTAGSALLVITIYSRPSLSRRSARLQQRSREDGGSSLPASGSLPC
jgi:hypothetical protein